MSRTAMIVDDERFARDDLKSLLGRHSDVEVVCEAGNVEESKRLLRVHKPDLLFLDIQLEEDSGFDLIPDVPQNTAVIFVTAWESHAVRAFEVNAVDYVLKPVSPKRLAESLQRAGARRTRASSAEASAGEPGETSPSDRLLPDRRLWLGTKEELRCVPLSDIAAVSSLGGNYSAVRTRDGLETEMRRTLKEWEAVLPETFIRVHRATIVNLGYVGSISRSRSGELHLELPCLSERFTVSRRRAGMIQDILVRRPQELSPERR